MPEEGSSALPDDSTSAGERLARQNVELLGQGLAVLARLDHPLYCEAPPGLKQSGVGRHLRHVRDFYACFLDGLERGSVDYDRRARDERFERDPEYAAAELRWLMRRLDGLGEGARQQALEVRADADADMDGCGGWYRSTVGRELRFLASHTVHHYALIALLLRLRGFECGDEFGVAPSTLFHQRVDSAACAPSPGIEA